MLGQTALHGFELLLMLLTAAEYGGDLRLLRLDGAVDAVEIDRWLFLHRLCGILRRRFGMLSRCRPFRDTGRVPYRPVLVAIRIGAR